MKNGVKNADRPQNKNLKPFKKGENMGSHRPKGSKNYETRRREAIIELGKLNKKTPEEIEVMLHTKAIGEALKGDFRYYKDDMDRTYGQPVAKTELSGTIQVDEIKKNTEMVKDLIESFKNGRRKKTTLLETPPPV